MEEQALVIRPCFPPGRRIITISDIHGNLSFFDALLDKIQFTTEDILVLNGDILEKGPDSLELMRHVMDLSQKYTIYSLCGNLDGLVYRFFETDALDEIFFSVYLPRHPESALRQMAREAGSAPPFRRNTRGWPPCPPFWRRNICCSSTAGFPRSPTWSSWTVGAA